jgi:hypothetical protein
MRKMSRVISRARWIATASVASGLILSAAGPVLAEARGPSADELNAATVERARDAIEDLKETVRALSNRLAREYAEYLRRAARTLDEENVSEPRHRDYFLRAGSETLVVESMSSFDSFASRLRSEAPPIVAAPLGRLLENERGILEDFLHENPATVLAVLADSRTFTVSRLGVSSAPDTAWRILMERAEDEAARSPFADRLRRAALYGDPSVRRLVTRSVRRTTEPLTDQMADSYVEFLLKMARYLDQQNVRDTGQRRALLVVARSAVTDSMIAAYDDYAAKLKASFSGSGPVIESATASVLDSERDAIEKFLGDDPAAILSIVAALTPPRQRPPDGRVVFRAVAEGR